MSRLPKRLITLNKRTDDIAERIKRRSKYGFSSWVRMRLIAWDEKQKHGHEESREVERLRLELKAAERHQVAWRLATLLSKGERSWVGEDPAIIVGSTHADVKQDQTWQEVVE